MSVKVASSRFIVSSIPRFYQQLFQSASDFREVGKRLISLAENARVLRQMDQVEDIARVLSNIPLREYQLIGQYYLSVCDYRKGELEKTQRVFEQVAETSFLPSYYRGRAMLSLAAIAARRGDCTTELYYGVESLKVSSNLSIRLEALKGIAVIKAKDGDHHQALKEIESLRPMLRYANPIMYYDCLNSLAVELGEVGRIEEAMNISNIVLASPFTFAYSQWRETGQDLALRGYKSRSSVRVIQSFPEPENIQNVLYMPGPSPAKDTSIKSGRARLFSLEKWKKKMVKSNGDEKLDNLTDKDLVLKILHMTSEEGMTWKKLCKIIDYISKVKSEPDE